MAVVFDSVFVSMLLHPSAGVPNDPRTGVAVTRAKERIELLIETLEREETTILIPTPVLGEFLVKAGNEGPLYLAELNGNTVFRIAPFDELAAIENANLERDAKAIDGDKRGGADHLAAWQHIKIDRQIIAIARVNRATCIYSDDDDVVKMGARLGMRVVSVSTLPLPPSPTPLFDEEES